jgi:hypothetical protein
MHEAAHFALVILSESPELEVPYADHLPKKSDLLVLRKFLIDRRLGVVLDRFGFDGGCHNECDGEKFSGRI